MILGLAASSFLLVYAAILQAAITYPDSAGGWFLPNGNFEKGPQSSQMNGTHVIVRDGIPNWEISGFVDYISSGHKQGDMLLPVPEGMFAVRLGSDACIKQRVRVVKGMSYSITYAAARTCGQDQQLNLSASSECGLIRIQTMYSSNGWDSYAWAWMAKSDQVDLIICNPISHGEDPACGPLVDMIAIKKLTPPKRTSTNLLKNGDFEEGPYILPILTLGVLIPSNIVGDHCPLVGWMVESLKAVKYLDAQHFSVPRGRYAVELLAGKESAIAQVVRTDPGRVYLLTFAVGDAKNGCKGSMLLEVFANQATVKVPYQSNGSGGSRREQLQFTARSARTRVVFFSSYYHTLDDRSSLCGPVVDDVRLVPSRR